MADDDRTVDLLTQVVKELQKARTIPSTALMLREAAVRDSVQHIRSDPRFDSAQVLPDNISALRVSLDHAPASGGLVAEFGVHTGRTLEIIAEHFPEAAVDGFDSFRGLPTEWSGGIHPAGSFDDGGIPPDMEASNVRFHVGWFEDTVPAYAAEHGEPFRFAHLDADLYSSTKTVFDAMGAQFVPGTVIVFDEYFGYHSWQQHEHRAFTEFLEERSLSFAAVAIGHMSLGVKLTARGDD